jgi:6-phosphogluconolactonase/Glucosamine-6-phosphate isomerase/deaminase
MKIQSKKTLSFEVVSSSSDIARLVASEVIELIRANPEASIGFPTGSSLQGAYLNLREAARKGEFSLERAKVFLLDEYVGLPKGSRDSYLSFIQEEIQKPLGLPTGSLFFPDVHARSLEKASQDFEERISSVGGLDLQILGIGTNGHIGFNEPGSAFDSTTRVVELSEDTRFANSRYFNGNLNAVPKQAITQGISTIMSAKRIILVAVGSKKADAVERLLSGIVSEQFPASALHSHPNLRALFDTSAYK